MKKMGIGLIGCGNISTAYLQLASQFSPLEMRAVADLDMAAAKTQAEKFNLRALSVPELLASGDIDIIVNLTVPAAHFGKGPVAVAEHRLFQIALVRPDDHVFFHLLADVLNDRLTHRLPKRIQRRLGLTNGVVGPG